MSQHLESTQAAEKPAPTISHRPERRRSTRDSGHGEPSRAQLIVRILGMYAEMPGLSLQLPQAARLFGIREATCLVVLGDLVRTGHLRQCADGRYRGSRGGA
jgi:hypothetical protein